MLWDYMLLHKTPPHLHKVLQLKGTALLRLGLPRRISEYGQKLMYVKGKERMWIRCEEVCPNLARIPNKRSVALVMATRPSWETRATSESARMMRRTLESGKRP